MKLCEAAVLAAADSDRGDTSTDREADQMRGGDRQVELAAGNERATVNDANSRARARTDRQQPAARQRLVRHPQRLAGQRGTAAGERAARVGRPVERGDRCP